jgi:hypothetical protein
MNILFEMSTTEGWVNLMWKGVDSTKINFEPIRDNKIFWIFFFLVFIVIGSLFIMNLFVGVVINTFNNEKEKLGKNELLTDDQREWVNVQMICFNVELHKTYDEAAKNKNYLRRSIYKYVSHPYFDIMILTLIMINTCILAIKWYNEPSNMAPILEIINYIFAALFTVEAIAKLIAYGC